MAKQAFDVDGSRLACLCPAAYDRLPAALGKTQPALFAQWLNYHVFGTFGGVRHIQTAFSLFYYLKICFGSHCPRCRWRFGRFAAHACFRPTGDFGHCLDACRLVLLAFNPQRFQDNLVWLLPPLALFGAAQLDNLRRGAAAFVNWFGIMAFGLLPCSCGRAFRHELRLAAKLAERAAYFSPYYVPDIDPIPMAVAVLFTPLWLWAITRKTYAAGRRLPTGRQALP